MPVGSCATQSSSAACASYIAAAQASGTQGTSYTTSPDSSVFSDPCIGVAITTTTTKNGTPASTIIILSSCLGAFAIIVIVAAICYYRVRQWKKRESVGATTTLISSSPSDPFTG